MNKKAAVEYLNMFLPFLCIITTTLLIVTVYRNVTPLTLNYGDLQQDILKMPYLSEKSFIYIDQAALQKTRQAVYDLGKQGGFYNPECGTFAGYSLWQNEVRTCQPNILASIGSYLKENLDKDLMKYTQAEIPLKNYDYEVTQDDDKLRVLAIATDKITFPSKPSTEWLIDKFPENQKECLEKENHVPFFAAGIYTNCGECPEEATCSRYINENFCDLDPCSIGCQWEDRKCTNLQKYKDIEYSLKPSFDIDVDYNTADYEIVRQRSQEFLGCEKEDTQNCINRKIGEINIDLKGIKFLTQEECEGDNAEFYKFIEDIELCRQSPDTDCECWLTILPADLNIDLKPTDDGKSIIRLLDENDEPVISQIINFQAEKTLKVSDEKLEIKYHQPQILVKDIDGNMQFSEEPSKNACTINKKTYRFCAETDKEFLISDNGETKKDKVKIKFALYLKDLPPPPIEKLEVLDNKGAEDSVILKWKRSPAEDVENYAIYYSQNDFQDKEINNHITATRKEVKATPITIENIDLSACEFTQDYRPCEYKSYGRLTKEKLYYIKSEDSYIYITSIQDNIPYWFAVTAIDIAGNEINNIDEGQKLETNKNYIQGQSKDDLAPGKITPVFDPLTKKLSWGQNIRNIDGSMARDISKFNIYYGENPFESTTEAQFLTLSTNHESPINLQGTYYFAITAIDGAGNEYQRVVPIGPYSIQ